VSATENRDSANASPASAMPEEAIAERLIGTLGKMEWSDAGERARAYDALERIVARHPGPNMPTEQEVRHVVRKVDALIGHYGRLPTLAEYADLTDRLRANRPDLEPAPRPTEVTVNLESPPDQARGRLITPGFLLGILVAAGLAAVATVVWPSFIGRNGNSLMACETNGRQCFDSGWIPVINTRTDRLRVDHSLGEMPRMLQIWFRRAGGVQEEMVVPIGTASTNPVVVSASPTHIELVIMPALPLYRMVDPKTGEIQSFDTGQYRIIAQR